MKPIRITAKQPGPNTGVIRLSPDAETVIRDLQAKTGWSATYLASQIIIQAKDLITIDYEEEP